MLGLTISPGKATSKHYVEKEAGIMPNRGAGSEKMKAALNYAAQGWPVFSVHSVRGGVCTCQDRDCKSAGKHPRTVHGLHDATTDAEQIVEWWTRWPDANI